MTFFDCAAAFSAASLAASNAAWAFSIAVWKPTQQSSPTIAGSRLMH